MRPVIYGKTTKLSTTPEILSEVDKYASENGISRNKAFNEVLLYGLKKKRPLRKNELDPIEIEREIKALLRSVSESEITDENAEILNGTLLKIAKLLKQISVKRER